MNRIFSFGHIPDQPDDRDFLLNISTAESLPPSIDLTTGFLEIKDQGSLGACTAFATTAMVEYVRNKQNFLRWDASPLFTYYATRKIFGTTDRDSGAYVRDALKSAVNSGVAKETTWPYIVEKFTWSPPQSAWDEAEKHQAISYYKIDQTKDAVLGCLAEGYPFTFGAKLYESFIKTQTQIFVDDVVPMPDPSEKLIGGHCMVAVGYLSGADGKINIKVRNSWGEYVGLDGYHHMPLDYILSPTLACDFWTIRSEEQTEEDVPPTPPEPPKPEPVPEPPAPPEPPKPEPVVEEDSIWKRPSTYALIGFGILALLFFLIK